MSALWGPDVVDAFLWSISLLSSKTSFREWSLDQPLLKRIFKELIISRTLVSFRLLAKLKNIFFVSSKKLFLFSEMEVPELINISDHISILVSFLNFKAAFLCFKDLWKEKKSLL